MNPRIVGGIALITLSCGLGVIVHNGGLVPVDVGLLHAMSVAENGPQWLSDAARFVSTFGDVGVRGIGIAIVFAALLWRQRWRSGAIYLVTVLTSIFGHTLAKVLWARPRPHLVPWLDDPHDMSFPSGHAAGSMVVLLLAAMLFDRLRLVPLAIALSLMIGLTRPMLGVHWPTDVVAGWLWGAGFALIGAGVAQSMGLLDARYRNRKDFSAGPS
ncbi:MAG: phosphatase PAP2 family protein [Sphingomonadales bacterium]